MAELFFRIPTLECIARKTLMQYDPLYLNKFPQAVPLERIIEEVFELEIDYMRLTIAGDELGRMIYDNGYTTRFNSQKDDYELVSVRAGTILIETQLVKNPMQYGRYRFTLAHELAHWILHKRLFAGTGIAAATYKTDSLDDDSAEWQANYLATAILMPVGQVKRGFYQMRTEKLTDKGRVEKLAGLFEVSKEAMGYRLKDIGLV